MLFGKKLTSSNIAKSSPEIAAMQKAAKDTLKKNMAEVTKGLPELVQSQEQAMRGLEQLSKNLKCIVKK